MIVVFSILQPLEDVMKSILDFFHSTSASRGRGRSSR